MNGVSAVHVAPPDSRPYYLFSGIWVTLYETHNKWLTCSVDVVQLQFQRDCRYANMFLPLLVVVKKDCLQKATFTW